ncbi:MAG: TIGR04222 domain-containing membrane protein [Verrucomicrobiota bacterium]
MIPFLFDVAAIPVFDWNGPEFLSFYLVSLIAAIWWSLRRSRKALEKFNARGDAATPTDPYELAYLSGGVARAVQLAVVRLLHKELIRWKPGFLGAHLIRNGDSPVSGLPAIESALLARVRAEGASGIPVKEACQGLDSTLKPVEVRLAAKGLRPTAEERSRASKSAILPMHLLGSIGLVKLVIGVSREKPVWFLVGFLVVTAIAAWVIASRTRRLTPAGERVLANQRTRHHIAKRAAERRETEDLPMISDGVALFGAMSLASSFAYAGLYQDLNRITGKANGAASGGCSSGCGGISVGSSGGDSGGGGGGSDGGGSGCGGGGCGGCGGGGD